MTDLGVWNAIESSRWFKGLVSVVFNLPLSIQTFFVEKHLSLFSSSSWQKETQVRGTGSIHCIVGWLVAGLNESGIMSRLSEGSPGRLQFQRVTMELFPSASAPCLIEQTYQCPFVEVSYIRILSATPQNRACSLCVSRYTVLPKTFQAVNMNDAIKVVTDCLDIVLTSCNCRPTY